MTLKKIFIATLFIFMQFSVVAKEVKDEEVKLTDKQIRALQSLHSQQNESLDSLEGDLEDNTLMTLRLTVSKLQDNQGQVYLGAKVNSAELVIYLHKLAQLLGDDFQQYRALQAARDHQLFHMTLLSPNEYQLADKGLVEKLLSSAENNQLTVNLLGLGTVKLDDKETFFVVAQSTSGQFIRQRLLLKNKDFHITLGFKPNDIYGVTKDSSTLIK